MKALCLGSSGWWADYNPCVGSDFGVLNFFWLFFGLLRQARRRGALCSSLTDNLICLTPIAVARKTIPTQFEFNTTKKSWL
ncbi:hypothetical protein BJX63DRAFT_1840 [Aspergillus granulosus]|uniref:Uncharacterized protein n=1 Tax=Aspergillus granulosus TaxID=176169 RepID=A0ABR4I6Q7_9EURO